MTIASYWTACSAPASRSAVSSRIVSFSRWWWRWTWSWWRSKNTKKNNSLFNNNHIVKIKYFDCLPSFTFIRFIFARRRQWSWSSIVRTFLAFASWSAASTSRRRQTLGSGVFTSWTRSWTRVTWTWTRAWSCSTLATCFS